MGVGLTLSGHDPEPHGTEVFADRRDYAGVAAWMGALPAGKYPAVDAFAREGRHRGTDALALQLNDAANDHPPPAAAGPSVELLLDRVGGGHPDETAELDY